MSDTENPPKGIFENPPKNALVQAKKCRWLTNLKIESGRLEMLRLSLQAYRV